MSIHSDPLYISFVRFLLTKHWIFYKVQIHDKTQDFYLYVGSLVPVVYVTQLHTEIEHFTPLD